MYIINAMIPKYEAKLAKAQKRMDEARVKMEKEKESSNGAAQEISDLVSRASEFDSASNGAKHRILARLIERIGAGRDCNVKIKYRISLEQYTKIAV